MLTRGLETPLVSGSCRGVRLRRRETGRAQREEQKALFNEAKVHQKNKVQKGAGRESEVRVGR